jgi:dynein assembly factor 2, axonemal
MSAEKTKEQKFEMPFDTEEKLLDAMNRTRNDLKLTKEEETRLTKSFKEPEFKKLLGEYMQEISDPKNRAEYEQYINQMESDDKVPKDMKIIKPKGGFVVKTKKIGSVVKGDASQDKCFINVCCAEELEKPSFKNTAKGQNWSLPHMIGPPHMVQDKKGLPCMTFEVCFHPETLDKARSNENFKKMVASVAFNAIKTNYKKFAGTECDLDENYRILRGVKAFGGKPTMLSMKKDKGNSKNSDNNSNSNNSSKKNNNSTTTDNTKQKSKKKGKKKKGVEAPPIKEEQEQGVVEPKVVIVERGLFDLKDTIHTREVESKRPKELVCKISLPRVSSIADVELDVDGRYLCVEVKNIYLLERKLPYEVLGDKGKAKWIKKKNLLQVTIPVKPPPKKPSKKFTEPKPDLDEGSLSENKNNTLISEISSTVTPSEKTATDGKDGKEEKEDDEPPAPSTKTENSNKEDDDVDESIDTATGIPGLSPEMQRKLKEAREAYSQWKEQGDKVHEKEEEKRLEAERVKQENAMAALALQAANGDSKKAAKQAKFIPASTFDGKKEFYVFKNGDEGLGYYWDTYGNLGTMPISAKGTTEPGKNKKSNNSEIVKKDVAPKDEDLLKVPPYRFRQDKSSLTLLVQVEEIDSSTVVIDYKSDCIHLKFMAKDIIYGFVLRPPEKALIDISKCRYDVSERNMAVMIGKKSNDKWVLNIEKVSRKNPIFSTNEDADEAVEVRDDETKEGDTSTYNEKIPTSISNRRGGAGHAPLSNKLFMELD